jgi:hypothetical protein
MCRFLSLSLSRLEYNYNIGILKYFSDSPSFFVYVGESDPFLASLVSSGIDFVVCAVPKCCLKIIIRVFVAV